MPAKTKLSTDVVAGIGPKGPMDPLGGIDPQDLPPDIAAIFDDPDALAKVATSLQAQLARMKAADFKPYPAQRAFYEAGQTFRERCLSGGNQVGKSACAAFELYCHATGDYPDWWRGRRFTSPCTIWAAGVNFGSVKRGAQEHLLGKPGEFGTGMIPADRLDKPSMNRAVPDSVDTVRVKHKSGGWSTISFLSYEQGRTKFQAASVHFIWLDEEPLYDEGVAIYNECLARLTATDGSLVLTFTPLEGAGPVVKMYHPRPDSPARWMIKLSVYDVVASGHGHITEEMLRKLEERYKNDPQREARLYGLPVLGESAVYPFPRSKLGIAAFAIPKHWLRIGGIDFGGPNAAAASLAYDPDADIVYVVDAVKLGRGTTHQHADILKRFGDIPIAWPHDGRRIDTQSGAQMATLYREAGLDMLTNHVTHEAGGIGVEAGVAAICDRMMTERFRVFDHLETFWTEQQSYYRKEGGKIDKESGNDHCLDAVRYATMALRFARPLRTTSPWARGSVGALRRNVSVV